MNMYTNRERGKNIIQDKLRRQIEWQIYMYVCVCVCVCLCVCVCVCARVKVKVRVYNLAPIRMAAHKTFTITSQTWTLNHKAVHSCTSSTPCRKYTVLHTARSLPVLSMVLSMVPITFKVLLGGEKQQVVSKLLREAIPADQWQQSGSNLPSMCR